MCAPNLQTSSGHPCNFTHHSKASQLRDFLSIVRVKIAFKTAVKDEPRASSQALALRRRMHSCSPTEIMPLKPTQPSRRRRRTLVPQDPHEEEVSRLRRSPRKRLLSTNVASSAECWLPKLEIEEANNRAGSSSSESKIWLPPNYRLVDVNLAVTAHPVIFYDSPPISPHDRIREACQVAVSALNGLIPQEGRDVN